MLHKLHFCPHDDTTALVSSPVLYLDKTIFNKLITPIGKDAMFLFVDVSPNVL